MSENTPGTPVDSVRDLLEVHEDSDISRSYGRRILVWVPLLLGVGVVAAPIAVDGVAGVWVSVACGLVGLLVAGLCHVVYPLCRTRLQIELVSAVYHLLVFALMLLCATQISAVAVTPFFAIALAAAGVFFRRTELCVVTMAVGIGAWFLSYRLAGQPLSLVDGISMGIVAPAVGLMIHGVLRRYADRARREIDARNLQLSQVVARLESEIEEHARATEELERTQSALGRQQRLESLGLLAGGIAHDFNNLLVGILGRAELLRQDSTVTRHVEHLSAIESSAQQAAELCEQLLAFTGGRPTDRRATDVNALITQLDRLIFGSFPPGVDLRCELSSDLPAACADRTQIQKVVLNMLINAGEALASTGGTVRMRTGSIRSEASTPDALGSIAPGEYVSIDVEDDGPGMDEETQARIFEPFFTTKTDGQGLGLAAVLGTIRSHGGTIQLDSAPGRGTRFRVLLPVAASADTPLQRSDGLPPDPEAAPGHARILVVDDEAAVREYLRSALEAWGHEVATASDARSGLARMTSDDGRFDTVILDMVMPDAHGLDLLKRARANGFTAPVILSSGYSQDHALGESRAQVAAFLQKPYGLSELDRALRKTLHERSTRAASAGRRRRRTSSGRGAQIVH